VYWLAPHVQIVRESEHFRISSGRRRLVVKGSEEVFCLQKLTAQEGANLIEMAAVSIRMNKFIRLLHSGVFLSREPINTCLGRINEKQYGYLSTRTLHPATAQKRIDETTIAILGVGGIGSQIMQHAVGAGFNHFVLLDTDDVEVSNLNRQFVYSLQDIGHPKINVSKEYILNRNPSAQVKVIQTSIASYRDLELALADCAVDILVQAADRPLMTLELLCAEYCKQYNVGFVAGAASQYGGYWGPLIEKCNVGAFNSFVSVTAGLLQTTHQECSTAPPPWFSYGPINALIASNMAHLAILYAGSCALPPWSGQRMWLDIDAATLRSQNFDPLATC
jgi:ThiF family